jgi:hypothetical protein
MGRHRIGRRVHADHALRRGLSFQAARASPRPALRAHLFRHRSAQRQGTRNRNEADVGLVFIDHKEKIYLSITARAQIAHDHAKAAEIWKRSDNIWWKGPDDPNVCVIRVQPLTAELWDGPASRTVAAFEFAKAYLTGEKPNLGENRKVSVKM